MVSEVRFLLFPCNQFGAQEPKKNSDIKTFAEQYVTLFLQMGQGTCTCMYISMCSLPGT